MTDLPKSHWLLLAHEIDLGRADPDVIHALALKEPEFVHWLTCRARAKIAAYIDEAGE